MTFMGDQNFTSTYSEHMNVIFFESTYPDEFVEPKIIAWIFTTVVTLIKRNSDIDEPPPNLDLLSMIFHKPSTLLIN